MKRGDHVMFTTGHEGEQVLVHVLKDVGDTKLDLQMPGGGVEPNIPHRERSTPEEDLGRTWQFV